MNPLFFQSSGSVFDAARAAVLRDAILTAPVDSPIMQATERHFAYQPITAETVTLIMSIMNLLAEWSKANPDGNAFRVAMTALAFAANAEGMSFGDFIAKVQPAEGLASSYILANACDLILAGLKGKFPEMQFASSADLGAEKAGPESAERKCCGGVCGDAAGQAIDGAEYAKGIAVHPDEDEVVPDTEQKAAIFDLLNISRHFADDIDELFHRFIDGSYSVIEFQEIMNGFADECLRTTKAIDRDGFPAG